MPCRCEECGEPTYDCNSRLCGRCLIKGGEDQVKKDIDASGRFYGEKLGKESET